MRHPPDRVAARPRRTISSRRSSSTTRQRRRSTTWWPSSWTGAHDPLRALRSWSAAGAGSSASTALASPGEPRGKHAVPRPDRPAPQPHEACQRQLPAGLALVYYASFRTAWCPGSWIRRPPSSFGCRSLPNELQRRVAGYAFAIESEAPVPALREQAAELFDELLRPLLPALERHEALVLIPDALSAVAIVCKPLEPTDRTLPCRRLSGSVVAQAEPSSCRRRRPQQRVDARSTPRLLAVGNPRLAPGSGLPSLRGAESGGDRRLRGCMTPPRCCWTRGHEARVPRLACGRSDIVHFAGHATTGVPAAGARLLLAPDPRREPPGGCPSPRSTPSALPQPRLVVLAACRTAAGERVASRGSARAWRGPSSRPACPMVVASLWDVEDTSSRRSSLRSIGASWLTGTPRRPCARPSCLSCEVPIPTLAHPSSWAGFVSLGGVAPRGNCTRPGSAGPSL